MHVTSHRWHHSCVGVPAGHDIKTCVCRECVAYRKATTPEPRYEIPPVATSVLIIAAVVIAGTLLIWSILERGRTSVTDDSDEPHSTAQGLAVLDDGGYVAPDDAIVADYQTALDALRRSVCPIPEERVADMALATQEEVAAAGLRMDLLDTINGAVRTASSAPPPPGLSGEDRCALVFTRFILNST